ncbi:MAG: hypothetical protein AAF902_20845 [Chloroflexota bacterium]
MYEGNKRLFSILYGLGFVVTIALAVVAIWPDLEAQNFSATFRGVEPTPLDCPIVLMSGESGNVTIELDNPLERRIRFAAISFISRGNQLSIPQEDRQEIFIEPNGTGTLSWQVDESNRAYNFMVLARIYVFQNGRVESRSGTCGVMLINQPPLANGSVSGQMLYQLAMIAGLICLFVGAWGLNEYENPVALLDKVDGKPRLGIIFTGSAVLTLVFALIGRPGAGVAAIVFLILIGVALMERPSRKPPI